MVKQSDCLNIEPDKLSRNVGNCITSQKSEDLIYVAAET